MTNPRDDRAWISTLIAVQEGRFPLPLLDDEEIRTLLSSKPRIALVGASANPARPASSTMAGLLAAGYDVVPVNPAIEAVLGRRCYPTVAEAVHETGPVGIVDVFRRPEACEAHARDAVAAGARCLWLQLGIASIPAAEVAHEAGLAVVMDRCTLIELHRLVRATR